MFFVKTETCFTFCVTELWCFTWFVPEQTVGWTNNRDAGDMRRHCYYCHYGVTVMTLSLLAIWSAPEQMVGWTNNRDAGDMRRHCYYYHYGRCNDTFTIDHSYRSLNADTWNRSIYLYFWLIIFIKAVSNIIYLFTPFVLIRKSLLENELQSTATEKLLDR